MLAPGVKTCFQRKLPSKNVPIRGTKVSLSNSQLLVSTGVPTLDHILGGGVAVGSVLLVEEDLFGAYGKLLLKYWSAEGVVCGHEIFLSSADCNPDEILQDLPDPIDYDEKANEEAEKRTRSNDSQAQVDQTEDLKIAWRYKHLNVSQPAAESRLQFGHYFDISKSMRSSLLESVKQTKFDPLKTVACDEPVVVQSCYKRLLRSIHETLSQGNFSTTSSSDHKNILRIALHSVGSSLWSQCDDRAFSEFCYALRMLLRSSYAVCLISVPTHLFQPSFTERIEHLADAVIRLESFVGTKMEDNITFKEYHGLLHVVKLPQLNSIVHCDVNTEDLAFKLRRKRFTIEKFHLPPALPDSDFKSSTKSQTASQTSLTCGSKLDKLVDF